MSTKEISPSELEQLIKNDSKVMLVDVRTPGEFKSSHIDSSINIPLGSKEFENYLSTPQSEATNIIICQGGTRAKNACNIIQDKTKLNALVLSGGVNAWEKNGMKTIKSSGAISMERQVRIAAGLFVFLGSILSLIIATNFIYVPIFVGAGLVFSGVTNTCGMARVLSVMPWNK